MSDERLGLLFRDGGAAFRDGFNERFAEEENEALDGPTPMEQAFERCIGCGPVHDCDNCPEMGGGG